MIPDVLLIEGVYVGPPQFHPGLFRLPVRSQLPGTDGVRRQPDAALGGFLQPVGTLHALILLFSLLDLSMGLDRNSVERRSLDGMRQFGRRGGLVHVLKPQPGLGLARGGVGLPVLHQFFLFGYLFLYGICLICRFVGAADMLLQPGVAALGVSKLEAGISRLAHRSAPWAFLRRSGPGRAGSAAFFWPN